MINETDEEFMRRMASMRGNDHLVAYDLVKENYTRINEYGHKQAYPLYLGWGNAWTCKCGKDLIYHEVVALYHVGKLKEHRNGGWMCPKCDGEMAYDGEA